MENPPRRSARDVAEGAVHWKARFIVTQDGHVDLPPDRHNVVGIEDTAKRLAFLDDMSKVFPPDALFKVIRSKLVSGEIKTREAADVVLMDDSGWRFVGNSNASAGYFYLWAFKKPKPEPKTPTFEVTDVVDVKKGAVTFSRVWIRKVHEDGTYEGTYRARARGGNPTYTGRVKFTGGQVTAFYEKIFARYNEDKAGIE